MNEKTKFKIGDKVKLKPHTKPHYYTSKVGAIGTLIRDSGGIRVSVNNVTDAEPYKIKEWYVEDVEKVETNKNKLLNYNHY